ncbi:MAG: CoA transferase [Pseudomonadales bacterium]|nr:CoA transferase [Pseudomonadales bacterium]
MSDQPLANITVLDFGQVYNGPYCGFLLAQAGARVIKVESRIGETLRARGKATPSSYPFALLNTNKECMTLNIQAVEGQALLKKLATRVDVVSENFAPGTMDKYGIGADALRAINPRLIYAASTGYGYSGPYRDYLGMDITLQAMTGVMSVTGEGDGPPLKSAAAFADFLGGTHLYAGIVTALLARERSGVGATVDISMQDCVFPTLATALGSYFIAGRQQGPRVGNRHPGLALAPYNVYPAADGYVAIICIREGHFRKLCTAMEQPSLADDPRFATNAERCRHMMALDALIGAWSQNLSRTEIFARAQANGVICAPVNRLEDVVNDPQLHARGTLEWRTHPVLGDIPQAHTPLRFRDLQPPALTDVPELGADTARLLGELLGLDAQDVALLQAAEAI